MGGTERAENERSAGSEKQVKGFTWKVYKEMGAGAVGTGRERSRMKMFSLIVMSIFALGQKILRSNALTSVGCFGYCFALVWDRLLLLSVNG